jgi:hypothetical protein
MKITIYELLGLIKDGKAPNKIKYCGCIYEWEKDWYLTKEKNCKVCLGGKKEDINQLYNAFNDSVEIIEEVEDKEYEDIQKIKNKRFTRNQKQIASKINELIDVVNEIRKKEDK